VTFSVEFGIVPSDGEPRQPSMRKETLFAVLGGITFGLVIAFGVWRTNSALSKVPQNATASKDTSVMAASNTDDNTTTLQSDAIVTIIRPDNLDVVTTDLIEITGATAPNKAIVISSETDNFIIESDETGAFTQEIELEGGLNTLTVQIPSVSDKTLTRSIVYSSELQIQTETNEEELTPEQKAEEKLEAAKRDIKAYIGTVTDKSEGTLQIKSLSGEIQLLSTPVETSVVNTISDKAATLVDVAIGDYVIVIGEAKEANVVSALRIIIDEPNKPAEKSVVEGTIVSHERSEFNIQTSTGTTYTVIPGKKATFLSREAEGKQKSIKFVEFADGDSVVVIGTLTDSEITADSIVRLQSK
jgi:hypothetical protein